MRTSTLARILTWIVAVVIGGAYGLAGTIAHPFTLWVLPVGLVLAIIGSTALLIAIRLLSADRWTTLAAGLGMLAATVIFSGEGPGGSVIVPQTSFGIVWTFSVPLVVAVVVAWPDRISVPARPARSETID
ncbi:histidinol dehydrogenase [Microbacterium sp. SLBN-154]|uniref:histidinol dehydrogenase n=1 Tax=Microbacterium sp. SLBN-154 TaxID=2768458 RepID=UPI0011509CEB|nr:histidinol dehydrogenase [Microbacterium sp. SLBN-154]